MAITPTAPQQTRIQADAALSLQERVKLIRDGIMNYSGLLLSGLVGLFLVPVLLRGLGTEQYGLWIAAMAIVGVVSSVDLGLGHSVTQAVASDLNGPSPNTASFVSSTGTVFLALGLIGGSSIALLGVPLSAGLQLSEPTQRLARWVFIFAGVLFLAGQILAFSRAVLVGLRRFDLANLLAAAWVFLGAVGVLVLLNLGGGLLSVAACQTVAAMIGALVSLGVVAFLEPRFRLRLGAFYWSPVRERLSFSLASQLLDAAIRLVWESPALLIGLARGSTAIVPYHIGQKFPVAASQVAWCAAEALYPAASPQDEDEVSSRKGALLEVGTRWVLILVLPLTIILWTVAPALLQAWLGEVPRASVSVLRVTTAAIFLDALGVGALYVLWGSGGAGPVFVVLAGVATTEITLGLLLMKYFGVVGMAWAMLIAMTLGSLTLMHLASRTFRLPAGSFIRHLSGGLLVPTMACVVVAIGATLIPYSSAWSKVASVALGGGLAYLLLLIRLGMREEEKAIVYELASIPRQIGGTGYQALRHTLKRVRSVQSAYYFLLVLKDYLRAGPSWARIYYVQQYKTTHDPYGYETEPRERQRLNHAIHMLDTTRGDACFERALEIGCSEGAFTEMLVGRCQSLVAMDLSPAALERARQRMPQGCHADFQQANLMTDSLGRDYDLVVAMSVLEGYRPSAIRRAREKVIESLAPNGYLLFSSVRDAQVIESAWWARYFLRGTKCLNGFFAEHPRLEVVALEEGSFYVHSLFRKLPKQS